MLVVCLCVFTSETYNGTLERVRDILGVVPGLRRLAFMHMTRLEQKQKVIVQISRLKRAKNTSSATIVTDT